MTAKMTDSERKEILDNIESIGEVYSMMHTSYFDENRNIVPYTGEGKRGYHLYILDSEGVPEHAEIDKELYDYLLNTKKDNFELVQLYKDEPDYKREESFMYQNIYTIKEIRTVKETSEDEETGYLLKAITYEDYLSYGDMLGVVDALKNAGLECKIN